jgi:hypothetical protein
LAVVTGEFGGNLEGVIQLPAKSGTGTPSVLDWVAFTVPDDPSHAAWSQGFDPHTVTAYVSPNSNKALGVLVMAPQVFWPWWISRGYLRRRERRENTHR